MILEVEEINAILCNFVQSYQHLISQCRYYIILSFSQLGRSQFKKNSKNKKLKFRGCSLLKTKNPFLDVRLLYINTFESNTHMSRVFSTAASAFNKNT